MNKMHEVAAAAGLGLGVYCALSALPSAEETVPVHNAAVLACSERLGGVEYIANSLPVSCQPFGDYFRPLMGMGEPPNLYIVTPANKFVGDNFITATQMWRQEHDERNQKETIPPLLGALAWAGLRSYGWRADKRFKKELEQLYANAPGGPAQTV